MTGFGHLDAGQDGLQLDVDFTSSFISKNSLNDLAKGLKETQRSFLPGQSDEQDITKYWDITGRTGFDFDSFSTILKVDDSLKFLEPSFIFNL